MANTTNYEPYATLNKHHTPTNEYYVAAKESHLAMNESYMSVNEFCARMQVSASTAYRMIKNRQIPAIKFGRRYKIPRSMFEKLNPRFF